MDFFGFIMDIFTTSNLRWMLFAYLLGSVPTGFLLARAFAGVDVRTLGSCSIGTTNVLRVVKEHSSRPELAKKLAIATMASDLLKGLLVVLTALLAGADISTIWAMAVLVVFGHCYSVFLGFSGGKGVATTAGALLALIPLCVLIGLIAWLIIGKIFKISSLASLAGICLGILSSLFIYAPNDINSFAPHMIILVLIIWQHLPNILRLIRKTECKVI